MGSISDQHHLAVTGPSLLTEKQIRQAIDQRHVRVLCQPVVDLKTSEVVALEALARIKNAHGELISPKYFMPVITENPNLSALFDGYVALDVLHRLSMALAVRQEVPAIQINLSPASFDQGEDFNQRIITLMENYEPVAQKVSFEILETGASEFSPSSHMFLKQFVHRKTKIIQDDHRGHEEDHQRRRDIAAYTHYVKTDGDLMRTPEKLRTLVAELKEQGCEITAEGIQNARDLSFVRSLGVDKGQGYYLGKPQELQGLLKWICKQGDRFFLPNLHAANVGRGRSSGVVPPTPQP